MKKETNSVTGLTSSDFSRTASEEETQPENEETEETTENAGENAQTFEEARDRYGNNLTETLFTDGEFGTIYKAFCYNPSCTGGNDLLGESDARGGETVYTVALETSRNQTVTDRTGSQTLYEYDAAGRTTKVTRKNAAGDTLAYLSYAYDSWDNLTAISRGDGLSYCRTTSSTICPASGWTARTRRWCGMRTKTATAG